MLIDNYLALTSVDWSSHRAEMALGQALIYVLKVLDYI